MSSLKATSSATLFARPSKTVAIPELVQIWPHSILQAEKIPLVLDRLTDWKNIVEELIVFVAAIQNLEKEYAKEYEKLASKLSRLGTTAHEPVSFGNATGIPIDLIQKSCTKYADQYLTFERTVNGTCCKLLLALKSDLTRKIKSFKTETDTLTRAITKIRTSTIDMITLHEKAKASRVSTPSIRNKSFVDPWLTERVLYKHLRGMIDSENEYQESILKSLKELQEFDEKVLNGFRFVVVEFLLAREQQNDEINGLLRQARGYLNGMESGKPFHAFATENHLFEEFAWSTPRSLTTFPYDIQELKILKQRIMSRQYFWSRTGWAQALFVVTESGYLHCFKQVHGRARGDEARRKALDQKKSWGISKKSNAIVPPSAETLQAEMHETPAYNDLDAPSTYFSICLKNSGRIAVTVVPQKANLFVFSIDIFKTPRDQIASKRYEIKANNESEMIEWVSFLKERIESYLPEGPPEPLFSAPHEILDKVESNIRRPLPPPPPIPRKKSVPEPNSEPPATNSDVDFTSIDEIAVDSPAPLKAERLAIVSQGQGTGEITGRTFTTMSSSATLTRPSGARNAPDLEAALV
ncbi:UNVERIFIED_CONTAM: hypothetical protein HDU68_006546 [Siphonaria sp. JEL0065]|nr:hypothetical protein HDU68_006546 [Siphonaria sp. JEL0065]